MRGNHSREERSGWRKSTRKSAAPIANAGGFGSRGRDRRQLVFRVSALATLAIGLVVIFIVYLLRQPDRDVPLIAIAVSQSAPRNDSDPLSAPPNPFAYEDVELFNKWFNADSNQHVLFHGRVAEHTGPMERSTGDEKTLVNKVTRAIATAVPGGPGDDMIAVFLTAHGLVHENIPYFLVGDSVPDDPSTWVSVKSLLDGIDQELKQHSTPDCRVILFIDAMRGGDIWEWGKFDDSFTRRCREVTEDAKVDRIAVFLSSDKGERSWWNPGRGSSLFAGAIIQAFTGKGDLNDDGYVTVGEIAEKLRSQVSTEAEVIWSASQHPLLLGEAARSWKVIQQPRELPSPVIDPVDTDRLAKTFDRIDRLWQRHNQLEKHSHPPLATNPVAWSVLEKHLARLDQLALSGKHYMSEQEDLLGSCDKVLSEFESGSPAAPSPIDLPELRLVDYFHDPMPISEAQREFYNAWAKEPLAQKIQVPEGVDEESIIRLLWPWLEERSFQPEAMQAAVQLIDKSKVAENTPARFLETHLIRLMTADDLSGVEPDVAKWVAETNRASRDAILTPDLRAYFWIRQPSIQADLLRMNDVDRVFSPGANKGAGDRLERMRGSQYAELVRQGESVSMAYRLRDQMLHEIPRLSQTLLSDVGAFLDEEKASRSIPLIVNATREANCLAAKLRLAEIGSLTNPSTAVSDVVIQTEQASKAFEKLRGRLDERVRSVSQNVAGDERGLRQSVALLHGAAVNHADQRRSIHTRILEMVKPLSVRSSELVVTAGSESAKNGDHSGQAIETDELDRVVMIEKTHPWVYWLNQCQQWTCDDQLPPTSDKNTLARASAVSDTSLVEQGGVVRETSRRLTTDNYLPTLEQPEILTNEGKSIAAVRQSVDDLDARLRSQTFLLTYRNQNVQRAGQARFDLDVRLFTLEHAARTLNEFWCEARPSEFAFCVSAATRLLQSGGFRLTHRIDNVDLDDRVRNCEKSIDDRSTLKAKPIGEFANGALLNLVSDKPVDFEFECPAVLPSGSISIRTRAQSPLLANEPSKGGPLSTSIVVPSDMQPEDDFFEVKSFFRGLRRNGGMSLRHMGQAQTVVYELPRYDAPKAFVKTDPKAAERIVFVFDCSLSMNKSSGNMSRLDDARESLKAFLKVLNARRANVGLILFGNRYGWVQDEDDRLVKDAAASGRKYKTVTIRNRMLVPLPSLALTDTDARHHPDTDVQVVSELSQMDNAHLNGLIGQLNNTNAIGVTPTYLAIDQAYDVIGRDPGHIIVLTDGKPFLTGGRPSPDRARAIAKFQQRSNSVRLSIVSFANTDKQLDLRSDFKGCVVNAKDGRELSDLLEKTLAETGVVWKKDNEAASDRVELGRTVAIKRWPPSNSKTLPGQLVRQPLRYDVQATSGTKEPANAAVRVTGGEAFQFEVQGEQLEHIPFPRHQHVFEELAIEDQSSRFTVLALPPDLSNNRELTLRLVVENENRSAFTPRPSDVWIDLVGYNSRTSEKATYSISVAEFELNQPVPVLICRVRDWPLWATRVQIDLALRFADPEAPRSSLSLDRAGSFSLAEVKDVSFRVTRSRGQTQRFTITETHSPGVATERLRIQSDPMPDELETRYYPNDGIVVRDFSYSQTPDDLQVFVTEKDKIIEGATVRARGSIAVSRGR
ncbi:hypothetical protein Q31b_09260 [Novipirellula aureliae]|uniref:VWFA domain-containing protein n=1 Tax=Novipirellula aureliae TaxID=2527966 RepID=A0A5C6EAJ8_9BACT|nr:VWA domain-containing protein [Novipirellula aureliae]TWU45750.1 hypothetical protein Q31b_09260 [Novipirellula aureliae]